MSLLLCILHLLLYFTRQDPNRLINVDSNTTSAIKLTAKRAHPMIQSTLHSNKEKNLRNPISFDRDRHWHEIFGKHSLLVSTHPNDETDIICMVCDFFDASTHDDTTTRNVSERGTQQVSRLICRNMYFHYMVPHQRQSGPINEWTTVEGEALARLFVYRGVREKSKLEAFNLTESYLEKNINEIK